MSNLAVGAAVKKGSANNMKMIPPLRLLIITMIMGFTQLSRADRLNKQGHMISVKYQTPQSEGDHPVYGRVSLDVAAIDSGGKLIAFQALTGALTFFLIVSGFLFYAQHQRSSRVSSALQKSLNDRTFCLEQVTEEKDWLMKEIHHRVKNTLQIVMSLLNTQLAYLSNGEAVEAIRNSQHRMYAISLIHQKLYQTESLSAIDMASYIPELLEYLKDALDINAKVTYKLDLMPLNLDVSRALPLGLIINEAVSNALKFAFPGGATGEISLELQTVDEEQYSFHISDNGVGLKKDFDLQAENSFGHTLMVGLTNQLGGSYLIQGTQGVSIHIGFNKNES
jgi:two-component sensor histidine kinase